MKPTDKMIDVSRQMRRDFSYRRDRGSDKWVILDLTGKVIGDCEDHAMTVLARVLGSKSAARKALLKGDAELFYVKTPAGNGHAVLKYNGYYICNRYPTWSPVMRYDNFRKYSRFEIVAKLLFARVL